MRHTSKQARSCCKPYQTMSHTSESQDNVPASETSSNTSDRVAINTHTDSQIVDDSTNLVEDLLSFRITSFGDVVAALHFGSVALRCSECHGGDGGESGEDGGELHD